MNAHRPAVPAAPLLLLLAAVAALFGCASTPFMPPSVYEQPMPTLEQVPPAGPVSPGSLFTDTNAADLAGDFRARHTGDVLIVKVRENSLGKVRVRQEARPAVGEHARRAGRLRLAGQRQLRASTRRSRPAPTCSSTARARRRASPS